MADSPKLALLEPASPHEARLDIPNGLMLFKFHSDLSEVECMLIVYEESVDMVDAGPFAPHSVTGSTNSQSSTQPALESNMKHPGLLSLK